MTAHGPKWTLGRWPFDDCFLLKRGHGRRAVKKSHKRARLLQNWRILLQWLEPPLRYGLTRHGNFCFGSRDGLRRLVLAKDCRSTAIAWTRCVLTYPDR
jgi:hypothetical protein